MVRSLERELEAVEEAAMLGPVPAGFLAGLSEPALREFLRRGFLGARYAAFAAYFPALQAA